MPQTEEIKQFDCIGVGLCVLDYLCLLPYYPQSDEKITINRLVKQGGGPVATAMVTLARLGARTSLISKIGSDLEGRFLQEELEQEGVDTSNMIVSSRIQSPCSYIWVDQTTGKRTIAMNRAPENDLLPQELEPERLLNTKILHIDGWETDAALEIAREARKRNILVVADFGSVRFQMEKFLSLVDFPVVSERFVKQFFGDISLRIAVQKLLKWGAKAAVATCGPGGAYAADVMQTYHQPAFKVAVVDTTGAGDVFHGAFIFGLLKRWKLPKIIKFASAVAALKCTELGGRTAIPTYEKTIKFIRTRHLEKAI
ncbi:hypothetical protein JW964_05135 [candidate division KSB1 bacterium]|nr:hypothetical protein [candidate division KSB1 bacterium]